MSGTNDADEVLVYIRSLKSEQEKVVLKGQFTRIEEYRAACAVIRNLERIQDQCIKILSGKSAAAAIAEEGLTEMPEEANGREEA